MPTPLSFRRGDRQRVCRHTALCAPAAALEKIKEGKVRKLSGFYSPGSSMAYPQGYLYQPSASLALYSCPAYSTSVISGPRTEELGRSSSGSAFAPYAGSTAFTSASPGYNSHLPYSADAAAAATFTSYVVSKLKVIIETKRKLKRKKERKKKPWYELVTEALSGRSACGAKRFRAKCAPPRSARI